jgi:hypothetical protein
MNIFHLRKMILWALNWCAVQVSLIISFCSSEGFFTLQGKWGWQTEVANLVKSLQMVCLQLTRSVKVALWVCSALCTLARWLVGMMQSDRWREWKEIKQSSSKRNGSILSFKCYWWELAGFTNIVPQQGLFLEILYTFRHLGVHLGGVITLISAFKNILLWLLKEHPWI